MGTAMQEAGKERRKRKKEYTPEDLLAMPDGHRYELIDGKLVERKTGAKASQIGANLISLVGPFVRERKLGKVFMADCGYQAFAAHPRKVRFADASFIARGWLPEEKTPEGHVKIAPDFGLEVVSPNDTADEVAAKRIDWQRAGVRLLWLVYSEARTVHVFRQSGAPSVVTESEELSGEDVLPGFSCRVADLFDGV